MHTGAARAQFRIACASRSGAEEDGDHRDEGVRAGADQSSGEGPDPLLAVAARYRVRGRNAELEFVEENILLQRRSSRWVVRRCAGSQANWFLPTKPRLTHFLPITSTLDVADNPAARWVERVHDVRLVWTSEVPFTSALLAVLASWLIALPEYCLQVPANRAGYGQLTGFQLKIIQEVITLCVFLVFAWLYLGEGFAGTMRYRSFSILIAVWFAFRPAT